MPSAKSHGSPARATLVLRRGLFGLRGNLDGILSGTLQGWARLRSPGTPHVGLFAGGEMLDEVPANLYREDLKAAGIGTGWHGFSFALTDALRARVTARGGTAEIRVLGVRMGTLGHIALDPPAQQARTAPRADQQKDIAAALEGAAGSLRSIAGSVGRAGGPDTVLNAPAPPLTAHAPMFGGHSAFNGSPLPDTINGYADYARYRYKLDQQFDFGGDADAALHYLHWYIQGYSPIRKGLRVPLSREAIEFLNTPMPLGGVPFPLSRVHWSNLLGMPQFMANIAFDNRDWLVGVIYWWAVNQSRALYCEDCLVPAPYIDFLSAPAPGYEDTEAPSTVFMERFVLENPAFAWFDRTRPEGRRALIHALMLLAVQRPDYLRYLPQDEVAAALDRGLAADWAALPGAPDVADVLEPSLYAAALRAQGFDLSARAFTAFTPAGHRIEAARLPAPGAETEAVDLQIIGPFEKASGLGQATRLSAGIAGHMPYSLNPVDFGLDNPAPEGFSRVGRLSEFRRAKVNLIHLNAESIPLVYAYAPDVFSGAYNIGYFYWELDSPAACHHLALEMLDEIWVSTEYGVRIYQPHTDKPVFNAGMCFEDLPDIDKGAARAGVLERFGWDEDTFVFMVAFDSFSFVQRKNPLGVLKAFARAFEGDDNVRLVIKSQNREKIQDPMQARIWDAVDVAAGTDPRITILNETLDYADLLRLKAGCDCYISLHRSEGWGFGMIEAMNLKVPVVCTGYSGNLDFCSADTAFLVEYDEVELTEDDYIFVLPGQKWAEPRLDSAAAQMHAVRNDATARTAKAAAAYDNVQKNFSEAAIARRYAVRLAEIMDGLDPQKVAS